MEHITLIQPDDFHIHLRQDELLPFTLKHAMNQFGRVLAMPNLKPPLINTKRVQDYYSQIQSILDNNNCKLDTLMTLYLTENTTVDDIIEAKESGIIYACKLYPKHGTTHSSDGIDMNKISCLYDVFQKMSELGIILCIHGEINDRDIDIFDRENEFIDKILPNILQNFPHLKIILEHITTAESVELVKRGPNNLAATITPQHLWYNRNNIFEGGIRPHNYCLPILKRKEDQQFLIEAATSGNHKYFIGTDSAPHIRTKKETFCGCAGCFTGYNSVELYLEIFDRNNKLENAEFFLSMNGPNFYNIPINDKYVTYVKDTSHIPEKLVLNNGEEIIPFLNGQNIMYKKKS